MSIAAVCIVKNECDIIELFIRQNAHFCDHIYILNHHSTDGTVQIIENLRALGLPVSVENIEEVKFDQAQFITRKVREIARTGDHDYIIPLDADEFLAEPQAQSLAELLASEVSLSGWARIDWITFCPIRSDYFLHDAPLAACFRSRTIEGPNKKIILGRDFAKDCNVANGNHKARNPSLSSPPAQLPYQLQHVPVRSSAQIVRKVLLSSYAFGLKDPSFLFSQETPLENFHWRNMLKKIRESNYDLDFEELKLISLFYGDELPEGATPNVDMSRAMSVFEDCVITMPELAQINLLQSMDSFVESLLRDQFLANRKTALSRWSSTKAYMGRSMHLRRLLARLQRAISKP